MKSIDEKLLESCRQHPYRQYEVVITTSRDASWETGIPGLDPNQHSGIGPGVFRAVISGKVVLELSQRDDIEEIVEDFGIKAS